VIDNLTHAYASMLAVTSVTVSCFQIEHSHILAWNKVGDVFKSCHFNLWYEINLKSYKNNDYRMSYRPWYNYRELKIHHVVFIKKILFV